VVHDYAALLRRGLAGLEEDLARAGIRDSGFAVSCREALQAFRHFLQRHAAACPDAA